jgi:hypothetical protein
MSGEVDAALGLDMLNALQARLEQMKGAREILFDLSAMTDLDIQQKDIPELLGKVREYEVAAGKGRTAWVAREQHTDLVMIANLLMLLLTRLPGAIRVRKGFTCLDAAEQWLAEGADGD